MADITRTVLYLIRVDQQQDEIVSGANHTAIMPQRSQISVFLWKGSPLSACLNGRDIDGLLINCRHQDMWPGSPYTTDRLNHLRMIAMLCSHSIFVISFPISTPLHADSPCKSTIHSRTRIRPDVSVRSPLKCRLCINSKHDPSSTVAVEEKLTPKRRTP